jgi:hypothetical protein
VTIYISFAAGHHAFVTAIARDAQYSPDDLDTVQEMNTAQMTGVFIIDPWMNIVCDAVDYYLRSRQKLMQWQQEGKVIVRDTYFSDEGEPLPVSHDYNTWHQTMVTTNLLHDDDT